MSHNYTSATLTRGTGAFTNRDNTCVGADQRVSPIPNRGLTRWSAPTQVLSRLVNAPVPRINVAEV